MPEGGSLGLVGESGCGKSTTGRLITRLYEPDRRVDHVRGPGHRARSRPRQMKPLRREIQMIFQDPYTSLNPRHTVGTIVGAPLRVHKVVPKKQVLTRVQELLEVVGLNPEHYNRYPQRVLRRSAPAHRHRPRARPAARSCSSPTSRCPRSTCRSRRRSSTCCRTCSDEFDIAFLFIAHDLAVVRHFCPEVAVMYLGKIVEIGDRDTHLRPRRTTPTRRRCCRRCPTSKQAAIGGRRERIRLEGDVPSPINPPSGCRFRTRCSMAQEICAKVEPPLLQIGPRHKVACHFAGELRSAPRTSRSPPAARRRRPGQHRPRRRPPRPTTGSTPGYADTWFDLETRRRWPGR